MLEVEAELEPPRRETLPVRQMGQVLLTPRETLPVRQMGQLLLLAREATARMGLALPPEPGEPGVAVELEVLAQTGQALLPVAVAETSESTSSSNSAPPAKMSRFRIPVSTVS